MAITYRLPLAISPFLQGEMTIPKKKTSHNTTRVILRLGQNVTRILCNKTKNKQYFTKLISQQRKT